MWCVQQPSGAGAADSPHTEQVGSPPLSSHSSEQISCRTQVSVGVGPSGGGAGGGGGGGGGGGTAAGGDQNRPHSGGTTKAPGTATLVDCFPQANIRLCETIQRLVQIVKR